ncbi:MAG: glutathione S-transferase family protein [Alphaproteobacteria bacterium]
MARLHHFWNSGNSYKIRLLLSELERPYDSAALDRANRAQKEAAYLAVNPRGQVPAWEEAPDRVLTESAAILFYLAHGTPLTPKDPWLQAQVVSWLLYEQQHLCNQGVGMAHYWTFVTGQGEARKAEVEAAREKSRAEFAYLEKHLEGRDWFVGDGMTAADIAIYGYTHRAPVAGIALEPYPNLSAWLARVRARPRHIRFEDKPA